ncbi:MAG TPA: SCO family protein [Gemmatimonadaceae bacterium]|jgi:protein SCO1/2
MRIGITLAAVALLAFVASCDDSRASAIEQLHGVKFVPPHAKTDFTLETTDGKPFHFVNDTRGSVTLLYFGYTKCPDVCPLHLQNIAAALKRMDPRDQAQVKVVFVTTDPSRDTPDVLRSWLDNFDKRFIGVRGSLDTVNAIQGNLGLPPATMEAMKPGETGPAMYGMGHAAQVLAFTPDDSLRTEYPSGFKVDDWVNDLPKLARIR